MDRVVRLCIPGPKPLHPYWEGLLLSAHWSCRRESLRRQYLSEHREACQSHNGKMKYNVVSKFRDSTRPSPCSGFTFYCILLEFTVLERAFSKYSFGVFDHMPLTPKSWYPRSFLCSKVLGASPCGVVSAHSFATESEEGWGNRGTDF